MPIEINSSNKLINCNSCIQHATCLMNRNITFDIFTLKYHILRSRNDVSPKKRGTKKVLCQSEVRISSSGRGRSTRKPWTFFGPLAVGLFGGETTAAPTP